MTDTHTTYSSNIAMRAQNPFIHTQNDTLVFGCIDLLNGKEGHTLRPLQTHQNQSQSNTEKPKHSNFLIECFNSKTKENEKERVRRGALELCGGE